MKSCSGYANAVRWDRIADPDAEPPGVEPGLQAVIDEVKSTIQQESWVIKRAFPYPDEILNTFLQRVFQQLVGYSTIGAPANGADPTTSRVGSRKSGLNIVIGVPALIAELAELHQFIGRRSQGAWADRTPRTSVSPGRVESGPAARRSLRAVFVRFVVH
jgi:hypothetical protein